MSEILISNVDLPKKEGDATYLRIDSYGHVFQYDHRTKEMRTIAKVVELPPHGDIKDTKDILDRLALKPTHDAVSTLLSIQAAVDESPTIIEASN